MDANTVKELKQLAAKEVVVEKKKKNKDFYDLALFYTSNGNSTYTLQNMLISVSDNIDKYADKEKWFDIIRSYYSKTKFNDLDQNVKDFFYTSALDLVESARAKFVACYEEIKDHQEKEYMKGHTALDTWNEYRKTYNEDIRGAFEDALNASDTDGKVAAGVAVEKQTIKEARQEFISELEGTEDVGYKEE